MKEIFTKKDLKNGMVVEYRDGERALFLEGKLIEDDNWVDLEYFDDNLNYTDDKDSDIMKVYFINNMKGVWGYSDLAKHLKNITNLELLWQRKALPRLSITDIIDILGYEFELID